MVVEFEVAMIGNQVRELSEKEMLSFFRSIPGSRRGSMGLMGGWAVNYLLKKRNVDHIGSRDIDVFYDPDRINYTLVSELIRSNGFSPHSTFRWAKYFDTRTGSPISEKESKERDYYDLVILYLDIAAPSPDEDKSVLSHVLDEPLLSEVFAGKNEYWEFQDVRILMPGVDVMVKMKIKSVLGRQDSYKREKDLADLVAMLRNIRGLWIEQGGFQTRLRDDLRDSNTLALKERLSVLSRDGTLVNAANALGLGYDTVSDILGRL